MPLPLIMQKGLSALLIAVKLTDKVKFLTFLKEHFTLSSYEIALSYQKSYESALKAIIAGLGNSSVFDSKILGEFACKINPNYLQAFAAHNKIKDLSKFSTDSITQCQALIQYKNLLFPGDDSKLSESELAALINDDNSLSITGLVLELLPKDTLLDEQFVAFLRYNDLLGTAILFFLDEELRKNERFRVTLTNLREKGLSQDVGEEIKEPFKKSMKDMGLSPQIKARDEFTHHNSDNLKYFDEAFNKFKRLPTNNPQYSQLAIMGASVFSSMGKLAEAEKSLVEVLEIAETEADRALAAFNLFQNSYR